MQRKIFIEGKDLMTRAYIGWQNDDLSLYGVREGYKMAADDLVKIAIRHGKKNRIDILDMYIFPIMHCYRHSIEISLKHIYFRTYHKIVDGHNLLKLWDNYIVGEVINDVMKMAIDLKKDPRMYNFYFGANKKALDEIRELIKELQGKDTQGDVWRYLMDRKGKLYFTSGDYIDYKNLKKTIGYLYDCLDGLFYTVDYILRDDSRIIYIKK